MWISTERFIFTSTALKNFHCSFFMKLCFTQMRTFCTLFQKRIFWRWGNYSQQLDSAPPPHMNTYGIYFEYCKWSSFGHYIFTVFPPTGAWLFIHWLKATHFIGTKRYNCSQSKQHLHIRLF